MLRRIGFLLPAILLLSSCEQEAVISYKVKNGTGSPVRVISVRKGLQKSDTVFIAAGADSVIAIVHHGLNRVSNYKETEPTLGSLSSMDVYRTDTLKSGTDFLKKGCWTYEEQDAHRADYALTVENADF